MQQKVLAKEKRLFVLARHGWQSLQKSFEKCMWGRIFFEKFLAGKQLD